MRVGVSADNVLSSGAPAQVVQELLEARLEVELHQKATSTVSERELARDWQLLQEARNVEGKELAVGFTPRPMQMPPSARPDRVSGDLP